MGKEWHQYEMVLILNRIVSDYKNGQGCDAKTFETYASSKQNISQWTQYVKIVAKSGGGDSHRSFGPVLRSPESALLAVHRTATVGGDDPRGLESNTK